MEMQLDDFAVTKTYSLTVRTIKMVADGSVRNGVSQAEWLRQAIEEKDARENLPIPNPSLKEGEL